MKQKLETIMEGLAIAIKTTTHSYTRYELCKRFNRANFCYLKRYGENYIPKGWNDETKE